VKVWKNIGMVERNEDGSFIMPEKYPDLKFMGTHPGSFEWSVDELVKFFDKFPDATVDMVTYICHFATSGTI